MGVTFFFTQDMLDNWDGRMVILNKDGKALCLYDLEVAKDETNISMQARISEILQGPVNQRSGAVDIDLDWKYYCTSKGPGFHYTPRVGKFARTTLKNG